MQKQAASCTPSGPACLYCILYPNAPDIDLGPSSILVLAHLSQSNQTKTVPNQSTGLKHKAGNSSVISPVKQTQMPRTSGVGSPIRHAYLCWAWLVLSAPQNAPAEFMASRCCATTNLSLPRTLHPCHINFITRTLPYHSKHTLPSKPCNQFSHISPGMTPHKTKNHLISSH
jgi:hypothetical protein